jgi:hypothetical protein
MNCSDANVLFGDALDGELTSDTHSALFDHLRVCFSCRKAYELESITKAVVKRSCPRVVTPPETVRSVTAAIEREVEAPFSIVIWVHEIFTTRRLVTALVASVAIAVFLVFFNQPLETPLLESDAHTASNDIIFQSLQNFARLRTGELKPSRTATKAEDVHSYLDSTGMDFAIIQPMDCCKCYGAATSEYGGVKLAHVVYTLEGDILYVYQVRKTHVLEGSTLVMPPAARTSLLETGWYTDPHHPDCNVIVWISDETLCVAVSSMKKDEMLALLNQN